MSWSTPDPARKLVALPTTLPPALPGALVDPPPLEERPVTVTRRQVVEETYTLGARPARSQADDEPMASMILRTILGLAACAVSLGGVGVSLVAVWFGDHFGALVGGFVTVVAGAMAGYALYPGGGRP